MNLREKYKVDDNQLPGYTSGNENKELPNDNKELPGYTSGNKNKKLPKGNNELPETPPTPQTPEPELELEH